MMLPRVWPWKGKHEFLKKQNWTKTNFLHFLIKIFDLVKLFWLEDQMKSNENELGEEKGLDWANEWKKVKIDLIWNSFAL